MESQKKLPKHICKCLNSLTRKYYKPIFTFGSVLLGIIVVLVLFVIKPTVTGIYYYYDMTSEATMTSVEFPFHQELDLIGSTPSSITFALGDDRINEYEYNITITNPETNTVLFSRDFENFDSSAYAIVFSEPVKSGTEKLYIDITCEECKNIKFATYENNGKQTLGYVGSHYYVNKWIIVYTALFFSIGLLLFYYQKEEKNDKK